jgi:hypothetical protein
MCLLFRHQSFVLAIVVGSMLVPRLAWATVSFGGGTYTQDFNGLPATGTSATWTNNSTLPGWYLFRQPAPGTPITSINVSGGTNNAGAFYSFHAGSGDQALGGVASSGAYFGSPGTNVVAGWIAVGLVNDTGTSISSVTVEYDGEQWRDGGGMNPIAHTMRVEFGLGATFETVPTWNSAGAAFDFVSPVFSMSAGALDGNAAANREENLGGVLGGLTWNDGDTLWLRWIETNELNSDHGLAIDNVSISAGAVNPVDADFDNDGDVDGRDFLIWQRGFGTGTTNATGDANGSGSVDGADLAAWQSQYNGGALVSASTVPEPHGWLLLAIAGCGWVAPRGYGARTR